MSYLTSNTITAEQWRSFEILACEIQEQGKAQKASERVLTIEADCPNIQETVRRSAFASRNPHSEEARLLEQEMIYV